MTSIWHDNEHENWRSNYQPSWNSMRLWAASLSATESVSGSAHSQSTVMPITPPCFACISICYPKFNSWPQSPSSNMGLVVYTTASKSHKIERPQFYPSNGTQHCSIRHIWPPMDVTIFSIPFIVSLQIYYLHRNINFHSWTENLRFPDIFETWLWKLFLKHFSDYFMHRQNIKTT